MSKISSCSASAVLLACLFDRLSASSSCQRKMYRAKQHHVKLGLMILLHTLSCAFAATQGASFCGADAGQAALTADMFDDQRSKPPADSAEPGVQPDSSRASTSSPGGSSTTTARSTQQQFHRHLLQAITPNAVNVIPGQLTGSYTTQWATVALDPAPVGSSIPSSFLGISHEWTNVEELNQGGSYLQLLKNLTVYGSGPLIVRIGGGSTDMSTGIPPQSTWVALKELHESTGMRFIFGLNFYSMNVTLAMKQMDAIQAHLPREAILALEVGNEPNFYRDVDGKNGDAFVACCYVNTWNSFALKLSCRNGSASCIDNQLAGPVWGHVNMSPSTLNWFLTPNWRWLNLTTLHWYKATRENGDTVQALLDEAPLRSEMANLKQLVDVSKKWKKELRVAEMNTISNSGAQGLSNSMAAALWTLDGAFEVAATGASGINLHWGDGLALYAALLRQKNGAGIVKPPYYAYLMFQMALGSGASFMSQPLFQATPGSRIKVWPLRDAKTGSARVVLINKDATQGAGIVLRFLESAGYGDGKLLRLVGQKGLQDQWGVKLGGMAYTLGGKPFGVPEGEVVTRSTSLSGAHGMEQYPVSYTISMPPGSAALLLLHKV